MGQSTLVERQYEAASELSEALGCALADVKSVQLALPSASEISAIELDASRKAIDDILFSLVRAMEGEHFVDGVPIELSASLVDWISTLRRGNVLTPDALRSMRDHVAQSPTALNPSDFEFLNQLQMIVDAHAKHLLHRLPVVGRV